MTREAEAKQIVEVLLGALLPRAREALERDANTLRVLERLTERLVEGKSVLCVAFDFKEADCVFMIRNDQASAIGSALRAFNRALDEYHEEYHSHGKSKRTGE